MFSAGKNPVLNAFNKALTKRPPGNSLPPALNHSISLTGPTGAPLVYGTLNGTNTSKVVSWLEKSAAYMLDRLKKLHHL